MKRSNTDNEFIKGLKDQISLPSLKLTNPQISVRAEPLKSTNPSTLPTKRGNITITLVESDEDSTSQERKKHEKVKELKKHL